jgi:hypothetical protein
MSNNKAIEIYNAQGSLTDPTVKTWSQWRAGNDTV